MGHITSSHPSARRNRRHTLAVPVDVVTLRSGVPASIPGRTVNVSEGGLAMMLAAELTAGEPVGVEFYLPAIHAPIQAKAIVRHSSLMHCGLQFVAMPAEQEMALRTWSQMADRSAAIIPPDTALGRKKKSPPHSRKTIAPRRSHARWGLMSAGVAIVVLAAIAWWSWSSGWRELERGGDRGGAFPVAVDVSSSVMGQRIVHRVDPIYPSDALKQKIEGEVTLETIIGEDGTVREVHAVSGPDSLRPAATDAVKWWRFEPYEVSGHPALVHTLIEIDFRLSR